MRAGRSEAHRAKNAGQKRHVVIFEQGAVQLTLLVQPRDHVQPEHVGLALFDGRSLLAQRLANRAGTVEHVLDAEAVGHLVEHGVGEERVERDVAALVLGDQRV